MEKLLDVENVSLSGLVGAPISVPQYNVSGGSGIVSVTIKAVGVNSKEEYVVENLVFTPLVADNYKIIYEA